jgi:hypothetical protein
MSDSKQLRFVADSIAKGVMPKLQHVSMLVLQLACDFYMENKSKIIDKGYFTYELISKKEDSVILSNPHAIALRIWHKS